MKPGGALDVLLRGGGCHSLGWTKYLSSGPWIHISALLLTSWAEVRSPALDLCFLLCEMGQCEVPCHSIMLTSGLERYLQVLFTHTQV